MTRIKNKKITIALAGNPNSGKTSVFNQLAGVRQKVGNFAGVTVEKNTGQRRIGDYDVTFVDLPGTYSLTPHALDEQVAHDFILNESQDVIINVIDSGSLERSLYLTTQLMEIGVDLVLCLNMWDEAEQSGLILDIEKLSRLLAAPVVTTVGSKGQGIDRLLAAAIEVVEKDAKKHRHPPVSYGPLLDDHITDICRELEKFDSFSSAYQKRWAAVKLLENEQSVIDAYVPADVRSDEHLQEYIDQAARHIRKTSGMEPSEAIDEGRYGFISGIIQQVVKESRFNRMKKSMQVDSLLTHPIFGYPVFIAVMWVIFQATFKLGAYPMDWIDAGVVWLQSFFAANLPAHLLTNLLIDGVVGGVGSVIIFLPNILILFLGIALLEDSGYMARVAFIMDKLMHYLGLHGKSFIPMLMGFGCSVPAIMATRTLESKRDRIITTLLLPMMSCSAKLPVYVLFAGAFFRANAGHVIFAIYLFGIVLAIIIAHLLQKTILKSASIPFVMELPPYRWPATKSLFIHMWERSKIYLKKMGGIIFIASVVLWLLGVYPKRTEYLQNYDLQIQTLSVTGTEESDAKIAELEQKKISENLEYSFIGRIGKFVAPAVEPLGFNWQMGVALVTGFVAKEVVVSTLGVLYQLGDEVDEKSESLAQILSNPETGITPLTGFAFMIFVLIYTSCIAAVVAIKRELGAKWMWFSIVVQTSLAWVMAFLVYQVGTLLGF